MLPPSAGIGEKKNKSSLLIDFIICFIFIHYPHEFTLGTLKNGVAIEEQKVQQSESCSVHRLVNYTNIRCKAHYLLEKLNLLRLIPRLEK